MAQMLIQSTMTSEELLPCDSKETDMRNSYEMARAAKSHSRQDCETKT